MGESQELSNSERSLTSLTIAHTYAHVKGTDGHLIGLYNMLSLWGKFHGYKGVDKKEIKLIKVF